MRRDSEPHERGRPTGGELNAAVARLVVRTHRAHLGRGPTRAHAFYHHNVLVAVLEDTMTRAEASLAEGGREDTVLEVRRVLQGAMRAELIAGVEKVTGRKVLAFMSGNNLEPDMASEVFVMDGPLGGKRVG